MAESWWRRTGQRERIRRSDPSTRPRGVALPAPTSADLSESAPGTTTILTWLWKQPHSNNVYAAEHVNIWAAMLRRNVTVPHRIMVATDMPEDIEAGVEVLPLPEFPAVDNPHWPAHLGKPQCHRRLDMYREDAEAVYGPRILMLDLDVVIAANIDDIVTYAGESMFMRSQASDRLYNGSLQFVQAGTRSKAYQDFTVENAIDASRRFTGSDQAWLHMALGFAEPTISEEHGVHFYRRRMQKVPAGARIMFFPGAIKPWDFDRHRLKWVREHYRGDA